MAWDDDQEFERAWWGDCLNTYTEETKQLSYARRMGLWAHDDGGHWPVYDLRGASVLDIGGGPVSLLLKCINRGPAMVVDPCRYPDWVGRRYDSVAIMLMEQAAEDSHRIHAPWPEGVAFPVETPPDLRWDEAWLYNVLQHTRDPQAIVAMARRSAKLVRIFEWIDIPPHQGHPQQLDRVDLARWLGATSYVDANTAPPLWGHTGVAHVEWLSENNCYGRAFYGVFRGEEEGDG